MENKVKSPVITVILWVLFLPIMASIAIIRSKKLCHSTKILCVISVWVIIFGAFAAYGAIGSSDEGGVISQSSEQADIYDTTSSETEDNATTVYITPSGKKYHLSAKCAGSNAVERALSEVISSYSPCKSCAKSIEDSTSLEATNPETTTTPEQSTSEAINGYTIVYTTPYGSKFHLLKTCAGKNAVEKALKDVINTYGPCKTCVGTEITIPNDTTEENSTVLPEATENTEDESSKITVYVTKTGKRYHYSKECAGKNATTVFLSEAEKRGLTLCNTCKNKQ